MNIHKNKIVHWGWLLAPAGLATLSQAWSMGWISHQATLKEVVRFQLMFSLWSWTLVIPFGWDKSARYWGDPGRGEFNKKVTAWWTRMILSMVILAGLLGGWAYQNDSEAFWGWMVFGAALGGSGYSLVVKEWLTSKNQLYKISQGLSAAFVLAAVGMWLSYCLSVDWLGVSLMWFIPHALLGAAWAYQWGWFKPVDPVARERVSKENSVTVKEPEKFHWGLGWQALGYVSLCSLDLIMIRSLQDMSVIFHYAVMSRLVFMAFMISHLLGQSVVPEILSAKDGAAWWSVFKKSVKIHSSISLFILSIVYIGGEIITQYWLGRPMRLSGLEVLALAGACGGRSILEACQQLITGQDRRQESWWNGAVSFGGLVVFYTAIHLKINPLVSLGLGWSFAGGLMLLYLHQKCFYDQKPKKTAFK